MGTVMRGPARFGGRAILIAALLAACGAPSLADDAPPAFNARPGFLHLRTGDVEVAALPNRLDAEAFPPGRHVLMLRGPMTPERRAELSRAGVTLLAYLPLHAWIADLSRTTPQALRGVPFVAWAGEFRDEWKLEPELAAGVRVPATPQRQAIAAQGRVVAWVHLFADAGVDGVLRAIGDLRNARLTSRERVAGAWMLGVELDRVDLPRVVALPDVQFVEEFPEYTLRSNQTLRWVVQSNVQNVTPLYDRGLIGTGQIIGVIDGRIAVNHCSFLDSVNPVGPDHRKIHAYNTTFGYNLHGTHVAATAAGDGGTPGDTRGVAYGARLVYNTYPDATESSMYERFELHTSQGAFVHTNSWGADWTRQYDGGCRGIDSVSRDYQDILILHAISDSSQVTNPENAKNSLAVTASFNAPNQENWCIGGLGPTLDGRRKPEVAAPGCAIISASGSSGCGTVALTGTSMSTPAVAGLAALVREYFVRGFYPSGAENPADAFLPSGQLLKATIVNSGVDMTGVAGYPNFREGWGRVLADNALFFAGDASGLLVRDVRNDTPHALGTDDVASLSVAVGAGRPLKITLAYADAPAEVNASYIPVNNLDLRAISPGGTIYLGNVFANGVSTPGGAADPLNNLEQVLLLAPEPGLWTIEVRGADVNVGMQGYALVLTGDVRPAGCNPDINADGTVDQDDIACLIETIAGGSCAIVDPDINGDGSVDQDDVALLTMLVAGLPCP
jgi:subtilisin family serine protease